jgi:hypothetical protein
MSSFAKELRKLFVLSSYLNQKQTSEFKFFGIEKVDFYQLCIEVFDQAVLALHEPNSRNLS